MDWLGQDKRNSSIVISRIAEGDNERYTDLPDEVINLLNNMIETKGIAEEHRLCYTTKERVRYENPFSELHNLWNEVTIPTNYKEII